MAAETPSAETLDKEVCRRFQSAWWNGQPVPIERLLPPEDHPAYLATLEELVHLDLEFAWKARIRPAGPTDATVCRPPQVEDYLARFPRLNQPSILRRLLDQEVSVRGQYGDGPRAEEIRARFPELTGSVGDGTTPRWGVGPTARAVPRLPDYEILGELGRGGMGVVYRARQISLNREVALKMVLGGARAGAEELTRFRREAEAVAQLQHPSIVQVYEIGEQDGLPYFSLELVDGGSLGRKIDGTPQPARPAAELVEALARAMHLAHRRGILHRDLKPANVLLTADGIPKITDFGLAKWLGEQQPGETQTGAILGTPGYMAPEQAVGQKQDIGVATDVYALGAILYELLTGRPPFRAETALSTLEQVRSQEPVAPSRLRPKVPRDLETICLKCLQKSPRKRYASALELANDLRRFREEKPIRARPTPLWEQGAKWAKRRPALAALLAVSGLAIASVVVLIGVHNARLQRERTIADEKRQEAQVQRERALEHLRTACAVVDQMLSRVGYDRLADVPYMESVRRELLGDALKFYQALAQEATSNPEIRRETGQAHQRLGILHQLLGDPVRAEESFRAAAAVHEGLAVDFPAESVHRHNRAVSLDSLGALLYSVHRLREAEQVLVQARSLQEQLVADFPDHLDYQQALADCYNHLGLVRQVTGRRPEAGRAYQQAVDLLETVVAAAPSEAKYRESLVEANNNLAVFLVRSNRIAEAECAFRRDLAYWEQQHRASSAVPRFRCKLARSTNNLGILLTDHGRSEEGEALLRRAVDLWTGLAEEYPKVPGYYELLGVSQAKWALLLEERGDFQAARRLLEQAIRHQRIGLRANPGHRILRVHLFEFYRNLAETRLRLGEHREAAPAAAELPALSPDPAVGWLTAARLLSQCVPSAQNDATLAADQRRELAQQYADRAVEAVCEAIRNGYKDLENLKKAPEFEVLRSRPDFQQLLHDLAEPSANDPRKPPSR